MQEIFVYNNLSKKKEKLTLVNSPYVSIYTCGPTVYDHSHIGHARSSITWDFIVRYLRFSGYKVIWTRNITDIDDKIINKSKELNISPDKIARIYTYSFHEDMAALNVEWPDYEPQATQYLSQMFNFIQGLIDKNYAYKVDDDVYFEVSKLKDYGKLKGQSIEDLEKGVGRIEHNEKKKNKLDFALWKGAKSHEDYAFDSPFGRGRPGWHLECSTMSYSLYKNTIDIHGGGDDLIFPHHENEIAQSEAFMGKEFVRYWLHNGMIMVNGKKMSKSEGNFITIKESLSSTTSNAIRLFVLNTHYRMPLNYTNEALISAQNGVNRLIEAVEDLQEITDDVDEEFIKEFHLAMNDDFNSSKALAILFKITDAIYSEKEKNKKKKYQSTLILISKILGLNLLGSSFEKSTSTKALTNIVESLLNWRILSKTNKDFTTADKIRDVLTSSNIEVKDLPGNTHKWKFKG